MALLYHNNNSISNVTSFAQIPAGEPVFLSTATASSSASISFNSTYINSDYKIYKFEFINMHPASDAVNFTFNMSTDNGSNYNVTKTTTYFNAYNEDGYGATGLSYNDGADLAQSTAFQRLSRGIGNENDENLSGEMFLYSPSSITYVKHFMSRIDNKYYDQFGGSGKAVYSTYMAGYGNTTSAVDAIRFQMSSGNIDAGQIKLYGIGAN